MPAKGILPLKHQLMLQRVLILFIATLSFSNIYAQVNGTNDTRHLPQQGDSILRTFTLEQCIAYALKNQPAVNQSKIDEDIAKANRSIALAGYLPQVTGTANYQHYIQLPTTFLNLNGTVTRANTGLPFTSTPAIAATQNIFSPDVLLASKTANLTVQLARTNTKSAKIDLVAQVSKSFYDVLLSVERINVYKEDTARLRKNKEDAYHRYVSGISDKVDFKQASIAINNSLAQLKTASEELKAKYAQLKQLMGSPAEQQITVSFDTAQMIANILADTSQVLRVERRVEFEQLQLTRRIQKSATSYYKYSMIPSISAFYNYNYQYLSFQFQDLYDKAYPNSLVGIQLSVPLFTGFKRLDNVHKSKLQEERIDWDEVNLKLNIYSEYQGALAAYKSNLYNFHAQAENVAMAREVYNIVKLQYSEGIKAYLDVIVAESDLQNSEINYLNALFQLLQSKIDLEKAMGDIVVE
jgi:outer membrane protein TolC